MQFVRGRSYIYPVEIRIKRDYKIYHLEWQLIHKDHRNERYKVWPVQAPEKYIVIENNRPLIRKYSKHRKPDWKQIEGRQIRPGAVEDIAKEIDNPTPIIKEGPPGSFRGREKDPRKSKGSGDWGKGKREE